jgi:Protein of unknown function (DUF3606)
VSPLSETIVSEQPKRGRSQDRGKVAGGQKHETTYTARKTGASPAEVRGPVKQVGNARSNVETKLGERKGPKRAGAPI